MGEEQVSGLSQHSGLGVPLGKRIVVTKTDQFAGDHNHRHLTPTFVVWGQKIVSESRRHYAQPQFAFSDRFPFLLNFPIHHVEQRLRSGIEDEVGV